MSFAKARRVAGLSQISVAQKVNVDQSTVSLWETGKTMPRAALLQQIAELYGCTVDDLLKSDNDA